ncbi:MAG TPA: hypothetical protein VFC78_06990 [Tepidisphaeraceae bacterium]|nr:hypothetical protein [Tepidisphaeraceae bacterium]
MMDDFATGPRRPNTVVVLVLMVLAALTFSYLAAYALPNTLEAYDMIGSLPVSGDPRPHWMALTFAGLLGVMVLAAGMARVFSSLQLRGIDRTGEE